MGWVNDEIERNWHACPTGARSSSTTLFYTHTPGFCSTAIDVLQSFRNNDWNVWWEYYPNNYLNATVQWHVRALPSSWFSEISRAVMKNSGDGVDGLAPPSADVRSARGHPFHGRPCVGLAGRGCVGEEDGAEASDLADGPRFSGACSRQLSTYQLLPVPIRQIPFQAGSPRQ